MNKLGETKFTKVLAKANTIRYNNIIISIDLFQKIILILLVITLLYVMYSRYTIKDKITMLGKYGFLVVLTR